MHKALVMLLVPGILFVQGFAPVSEEIDEDADAEVDQALQPFWDLLLAKVTVFSETWTQRIKEVMRSLAYPKGHHHKCVDSHHNHKHKSTDRMGEEEHQEEPSAPSHEDQDHDINEDHIEPEPIGDPENSQGE